jgi:hypothetical protein
MTNHFFFHLICTLDIRRKSSELPDEKSSTLFQTDKKEDEQPVKKKRGRKRKSELKVNLFC